MRDNIDFATTNIRRLFAKLLFPTLFGMLFSMAFIFTDGIFVGHGIGPHGLASINLIGPVMMLISGLGMMFGSGASVVAAIHLSQGNIKAARINVTQVFLAGVIVSILMGVVCYCFPRQVLTILGACGPLYESAYEYYIWFIPTCLLMMIETIGLFVIRLDGSPRYAMMANVVPAIVNIVLDYIFIFPCHMGLMGASLATDIGGFVAVAMVAYYMLFRAKTLKFYRLKMSLKSLILTLRNLGYMIRIGTSGLVGELSVAVMMLAGNTMFMRHLGSDGVSAYSVACYLFPLVYMVYCAVAQSAQPIISYNYGNSSMQRVRKTVRYSLLISIVIGLLLSLVMILFSPEVVSIFINDGGEACRLSAEGLPYYAAGFTFMAVNICYVGYCQSVERAGLAILVTLLRGVVFIVPAFILLPTCIGTKGLWLSVPVSEALTTVTVIVIESFRLYKMRQQPQQ